MLRNLLKHSLRSFKRQVSYVLINILGLSIGIACSLLIALYIINESTYDRYNVKKDRIFRTILNGKISGQEVTVSSSPAIMGPTLVKEFPEVESFCRMTGDGPTVIEYAGQVFTEKDIIAVDSSFFNFFSIPVLKGDPASVLNDRHEAVLSESTVKKIFGEEDPIGKQIKIGTDTVKFTITGIMADVPEKTHFRANVLTSIMTSPWRVDNPTWMSNNLNTYLLLKPNSSAASVDGKFHDLLVKYVGPEIEKYMGISMDDFLKQGNKYRFYLQNLTDFHLDPSIQAEFKPAIDTKYLQIFAAIAIMIVLIAAINFMNLATAQASRRAKEVGVKKVGGSTRGMLIFQFLSETFMLTLVALILALILIKVSLPWFSSLLDVNLSLKLLSSWYIVPALVLFAVFVGILAGSYPAFFLSSFNPYEVLKGSLKSSSRNGILRRVLVIFQFSVSILLIIGTMLMYRQINYMLNKDVGFDKKNLIVIERAHAIGGKMQSFKNEIKQIPGVVNISSSTAVPGNNNNNNGYGIEGRSEESFLMTTSWVDYDFIETYGIKLASGRFFDNSYTSDSTACLVNESAIKNFSITDPEHTRVMDPNGDKNDYRQILGVMKNFNFESLRNPIYPYIVKVQDKNFFWGYITIRLRETDQASTIAAIESKWKEFIPNTPLQYYYLEDNFKQMYKQEKQNAKMAVIFSILAIFVASLGLFGLTSYTVEQRTKEIGVRKAMGSSIGGIYVQISKEIVILVSVSSLIAWPVVYYWAGKWLQNFYYHISPGIFSFVLGLLIAIGIAVLTISYRVLKAARVNPAQSLKYE
ncbi:MAG TPA: ABC transporter permease [Bacteroidales bacterium]|nr:ABC transporter permease [Bacteroidales bacterium]